MLAASSLGSRTFVLGASALLHVAVFAAAGRGMRNGGNVADADATPVLEIPIDLNVDPQTVDAPAPAHEHHHTHTHAYPVSPDHDLVDHDPSIVHTPYAAHDHADHDRDEAREAAAASPTETITEPAATPRFTIVLGASSAAHGAVTQNGADAKVGDNAASNDAPIGEEAVSSRASLLRGGVAAYPADAREAEIEADVPLEIVVDASGGVSTAHPVGHIGYGLDEAAVTAVRRYRFSPAQRGGHPVAVRMRWVVQFRLK